MKKLTYNGKEVKVVKYRGRKCTKCIFLKNCIQGFASENFEKENKLKSCIDAKVRYIYA